MLNCSNAAKRGEIAIASRYTVATPQEAKEPAQNAEMTIPKISIVYPIIKIM
jgi:hypothetical protein